MTRSLDALRKAVSVGIATLMLSLSVAVPLLESVDVWHGPVAESAHEPGSCPMGHDHTVCTQVGANAPVAAHAVSHAIAFAEVGSETATGTRVVAIAPFPEGHPTRAPPLA